MRVLILPCRAWTCEYCFAGRQNQLKAIAASGEPNICLTLTVNSKIGGSQVERYKGIHAAWKNLAKRIIRQFAKPAKERWILKSPDGYSFQSIRSYRITVKDQPQDKTKLHYMAFAEETEKGEPHLHILLRTAFIPQSWISQQMKELLQSPIVWIEKIKGVRAAIRYVTKYVTKAPAQFGKSKRYWMSKNYQINKVNADEVPVFDRSGYKVLQQRFQEFVSEVARNKWVPLILSKRHFRLLSPPKALEELGHPDEGEDGGAWAAAYILVGAWRQQMRV
jgi:hypothetical protein